MVHLDAVYRHGIILILILLQVKSIFNQRQRLDILGLFTTSGCQQGREFECNNALANQKAMLEVQRRQKFWYDAQLCFKDIQNNSRLLMETILPLTTDEKQNYVINDCVNKDGTFQGSNNKIMIVTYLSFQLTRLVSSLILPIDSTYPIMLVSVTDRPMYPSYYIEHPMAIYSYEGGFGAEMQKEFSKIKTKLNISYSAVINLSHGETNSTDAMSTGGNTCLGSSPSSSAFCLYSNMNPNDCYKELNININNKSAIEVARNLTQSYGLSFVILAGDSRSIVRYRKKVNANSIEMRGTFYLPYITQFKNIDHFQDDEATYDDNEVFTNFQGSLALNAFLFYALDLPTTLLKELRSRYPIKLNWSRLLKNERFQDSLKSLFGCPFIKIFVHSYRCGDDFTIKLLQSLPSKYVKIGLNSIMSEVAFVRILVDFWKKTYYIENVSPQKLLNQWSFNPTEALKARPFCEEKIPNCTAGHELTHSFYKEDHWKQSYGWNCVNCKQNFYKSIESNNQSCQECHYPNTVNQNHTECYNPFTEVTLKLGDRKMLFVIAPSALLTAMTIFAMVLFLLKRKSPIVKLANRKMTMIQLTSHLMLFTLPIYLHIHTFPAICIGRQLFLGIFFSITLSINISKSQKLYMIVTSKVRMSKSEVLMTNASEWIIILVALLVNILLNVLFFMQSGFQDVTVVSKYFDSSLTKEVYCSNRLMIYVQILMATVLSLCNGIQGFRARNLPSRFQETNHVIYSSFISMVVFIGASVVFFTRESMIDRSFLVLLVTTLFNATHFVLLYGYKMFVMVFRPRLNTKEAINKQRLQVFANKNTC